MAYSYDVVIIGATPGGIAAAIRSAKEGLSVLLAEASNHVGGMWTSGLQGLDTRYAGHRCPVLTDFVSRVQQHYRKTFGEQSPEYAIACFGDPTLHGQRPRFEPSVAETILRKMIGEHAGIQLQTGWRLAHVVSENTAISRNIRQVQLSCVTDPHQHCWVDAPVFIDATYEADLVAAAGAPFRLGREDRSAFNEPHAGKYWSTLEPIGEMGLKTSKRLNLHYFNRTSRQTFKENTGKGDHAIQGYALRMTLTDDPENRVTIEKPDDYDRQRFVGMLDRSPEAHTKGYPLSSHFLKGDIASMRINATLPNRKADWLGVNYVGHNHDYPQADWQRRQQHYREHANHSLGALYFLQHDEQVPAQTRKALKSWGLPRDEYVDNHHLPWMIYIREARRLKGVYTFTEHDGSRHPLHQRTPIHTDAVAFAEWPMDSHDCNPVRLDGSLNDGEFILAQETLPSQISYGCLISDAVENLLVPVCMSATHVGWGTLRLEPVFVHTGEVAGLAAAMCVRENTTARQLNASDLQNQLLQRQVVISYLSDVKLGDVSDASQASLQLLSTRGFFGDYATHADQLLTPTLAQAWQHILSELLQGIGDANAYASSVCQALAGEPSQEQVSPQLADNIVKEQIKWDWQSPQTIGQAAARIATGLSELR